MFHTTYDDARHRGAPAKPHQGKQDRPGRPERRRNWLVGLGGKKVGTFMDSAG